jgi:hypothetical protein
LALPHPEAPTIRLACHGTPSTNALIDRFGSDGPAGLATGLPLSHAINVTIATAAMTPVLVRNGALARNALTCEMLSERNGPRKPAKAGSHVQRIWLSRHLEISSSVFH